MTIDPLEFKLKFLENVDSFAFADNSVTTSKIANGAVTAEKLASGAAATTGKAIAMAIVFGGG
jgi:hypothetical protein